MQSFDLRETGTGEDSADVSDEWLHRQQCQRVVDILPVAAIVHTVDTYRIVAANQWCETALGLPAELLRGRPVLDFVPTPDRGSARTIAEEQLSAPKSRPRSLLRRLTTADGSVVTCWMHIGVSVIDGERYFVVCMDLVDRVSADVDTWRRRADLDDLTGLLRHGPLVDTLTDWVHRKQQITLAFLDVNNFKRINDTYGHAAGDHVLTVLAERLTRAAPGGSVVARMYGDEFVVAFSRSAASEGPAEVLCTPSGLRERLQRELSTQPIPWGATLLDVRVSIGAVEHEGRWTVQQLLDRADSAMYSAKRSGATGR